MEKAIQPTESNFASNHSKSKQGLVLVADDEDSSRRILKTLLNSLGYEIILAEDGSQALEMVKKYSPDVILLDVVMPEMDGFEVCRKLKQNSDTAIIPVVMVTSLNDHDDLLRGIESGATDFISKPVDLPEIKFRVKNALHTKRLYDQLQKKLIQLEEVEHLRDSLVHMIIHDIRSPLTVLISNLAFFEMDTLKKMDEEEADALNDMVGAAQTMNTMVSSVLDISKLELGEFPLEYKRCDLNDLANDVTEQMKSLTQHLNIQVTCLKKNNILNCDHEIVKRIIINILSNAIKYSKTNDSIYLTIDQDETMAKISISDNGPGIPEKYYKIIFDKFGQVKSKHDINRSSYGLGLAFCKLAVDAHGGEIGVKSNKDRGCQFWFSLPIHH